jgi:hypothetical protein
MQKIVLLFLLIVVVTVPALAETTQTKEAPAPQKTASGDASMPMVQGGQSMTQVQPNWPMQGQWGQYPQMSGMGGMGCGGMGMGGMGMGMQSYQPQLGHNMDQGLTMRDTLYIISMQDALQLVLDMARIQEKVMGNVSAREKEALRREIEQLKEKTKKLMQEYRGYISGHMNNQ